MFNTVDKHLNFDSKSSVERMPAAFAIFSTTCSRRASDIFNKHTANRAVISRELTNHITLNTKQNPQKPKNSRDRALHENLGSLGLK
jgi:hypothetical protein